MKKLLGAFASVMFVVLFAAPAANAQAGGATITLLHGIPATPVDVEANGANVFTNFQFGQTKDLSSLAGQTLVGLKVKAAGTATVAIDAGNVALPATGNYTVVAHLDAAGAPKLSVFQNDVAKIASGKGRVTVRHTAAAPAVDVRANGAVAFANVTNPNEAKADLAIATLSVDVVAAGTSGPAVLGPTNLPVANGVSTIVYAVGSLSGSTLQLLTQSIGGLGTPAVPSAAAGGATIMLLHGIPNTPVDVEVDNAVVIAGFQFGQMQNLSALSGATLKGLKVKAAGTATVAIDAGDVALPASGNYTIVAHLDAAGKPKLTVFTNDTTTLPAGKGRLIVRHTAFAPSVDIRAGGAVVFAGLTNPNEAKADLAAGVVSADVVPAGAASPVVIGPANLPITDGQALIVYAVGSLSGNNLQVLTQTIDGIGTAPTRVNTGNSPVADGQPVTMLAAIAVAIVLLAGATGLTLRRAHA
ncbi:MAG: DUF4397 domain-containing protein [Acidimicrobiales bacterium]